MQVGYRENDNRPIAHSLLSRRRMIVKNYVRINDDKRMVHFENLGSSHIMLSPRDAMRFATMIQRYVVDNFDLNQEEYPSTYYVEYADTLNEDPSIPAAQ